MTRAVRIVGSVAAALLAAASFVIVATSDPHQPGDPAVYDRIANATTCPEIRAELDGAAARHEPADVDLAYARAAEQSLERLGCG